MSELDPTKLDKLKVAELQDELRSRGLDTKGKKAVLISRLKKALKGGDHNASSQSIDTSMDGDADTSQSLDESSQEAGESQQSSQEEEPQEPAPVATVKPVPEEVPEDDKPVVEEVAPSLSETEEPDAEPEADQVPADESESANDQPEDDVAPFEEPVQEVKEEDSPEEVKEEPKEEENSKPVEMPVTEQEDQEESKPEDDQMDTDQAVKHEADEGWEANQEEKMEPDQTETKHEPEEKVNENGVKMEEEEEEKPDHDNDRGEKRQRSRSKSRSKSRSRSRSPRERRGRRRSRSKSHEREKSNDRSSEKSSEKSKTQDKKKFRPRSPIEPEDDTWKEWTHVSLDKYNSDLFLKISKNGLCGKPATDGGFAMIWAGARASYGVKGGKVAYQVKLTENLEVEHLEADEANPHVLRVGWSTDDNNMLLGEEELSYGYGGTGKASTNLNFVDYGEQFTAGDVVTAYLNLESDPCVISYEKNGTDLGTCFEVEKTKLGDKAMFPHVLTKNTAYECNFGAMEEPYFPIKEDYVLMDKVAVEERVKGTGQPENKIDCEIIMMVGLPASGKTTWVEKYNADNPNAKFNILGTNFIIDKMKVMGLPRKRNYAGRWDVLIDKSTKCLNRMLEIASKRKRNYIVDQTNVYASARRRKMQPFEGFSRRAVVVVPTDEDYKTRLESQQKVEGKEVPEKAIYEMKANFTVPDVGMLFDEVEFPELQKEEAEKLVEKYREEGQKNLPLAEPPAKRFKEENGGKRDRDRGSRWSDNTDRHSSTGSGGSRDGGGGRDSRGGKSWGGGGRDSRGGGGGGRWGGPDGGRDGGRWGGGGGGRVGAKEVADGVVEVVVEEVAGMTNPGVAVVVAGEEIEKKSRSPLKNQEEEMIVVMKGVEAVIVGAAAVVVETVGAVVVMEAVGTEARAAGVEVAEAMAEVVVAAMGAALAVVGEATTSPQGVGATARAPPRATSPAGAMATRDGTRGLGPLSSGVRLPRPLGNKPGASRLPTRHGQTMHSSGPGMVSRRASRQQPQEPALLQPLREPQVALVPSRRIMRQPGRRTTRASGRTGISMPSGTGSRPQGQGREVDLGQEVGHSKGLPWRHRWNEIYVVFTIYVYFA